MAPPAADPEHARRLLGEQRDQLRGLTFANERRAVEQGAAEARVQALLPAFVAGNRARVVGAGASWATAADGWSGA